MRLLKRTILMSRLRRMACIRWLPPMLSPSPSPVTTQTEDPAGPISARWPRPGPGRGSSGCRRCQVVWESAGAADSRDEDQLLLGNPQSGENFFICARMA